MKTTLRAIPILIALTLVAAACAGGDDAAMTTAAAGYDYDEEAGASPATTMVATTMVESAEDAAREAPEGDDGSGTDAEIAVIAADPAALGRMIVYTATIQVEVEDVLTAAAEAQAAVAGLGGILFGQETTTGDDPRSVLTIKVPPADFQTALERLSGVGELISQSVFADDVTDRVVDLESRITTAETSVERLRGFLEDATDLEAVAVLEQELLKRETELELLRGQLRTLEDQVALATIVLILTEPVPPTPMPAVELIQTGYVGHDAGDGCPGAEELRVDEAEEITICFEVTNTGDTALIDVEVRDPGLDADEDDMTVVLGDPESPLVPGERMIFAYEMDADPRLDWTDPRVQATAVDDDGDPIRIEVDVEGERLALTIDADDSLPGFLDGLSAAWSALLKALGVVVLFAGAAIPFLWVPVLIAAALWYTRRRQRGSAPTPPDAEPSDGPAGRGVGSDGPGA